MDNIPPMTTNPAPSLQTSIEPVETNNSKLLLISLIVLVVTAITVASYFGYQYSRLNKQVVPFSTPPIPSNELESWKSYTNIKYSFGFSYPQDYSVQNNTLEGFDNNTSSSNTLAIINNTNWMEILLDIVEKKDITLSTYSQSAFTTISNFKIREDDKKNKAMLREDNSVIVPLKNESINGINTQTFTIKGNTIGLGSLIFTQPTKGPHVTKYIIFESQDYFYNIAVLIDNINTASILSTFTLAN